MGEDEAGAKKEVVRLVVREEVSSRNWKETREWGRSDD